MAKNNNLQDFLKDIADAIREKKGTESAINAQDYHDEILSIQTGDFGTPIYEPLEPLHLATGISYAPPPYFPDGEHRGENIYGQSGERLSTSGTITNTVDLTNYTSLTVLWDDDGTHSNYGEIYATIDLDAAGVQELFRSGDYQTEVWGGSVTNYDAKLLSTFDITSITGAINFTFTAYAYSASPQGGWQSQTIINIYKIYVK